MTTKNKGGRPALPDAEKSKVRSMRLTDARWDKLKRPNPAISGGASVRLTDGLGVLLNGEETMEYTAKLPTEVGLYRHRWDFRGQMREQVLFVGYTNARAPRLQGIEPNAYMPRKLKCCKPDEHLHADRLTPKEWGGWWARIETPNQ